MTESPPVFVALHLEAVGGVGGQAGDTKFVALLEIVPPIWA